jgi:hypothetical protein
MICPAAAALLHLRVQYGRLRLHGRNMVKLRGDGAEAEPYIVAVNSCASFGPTYEPSYAPGQLLGIYL